MRIALGLSYDGASFHGWQTQPSRLTVQDTLEEALSSFLDHPVQTVCAGRTDTGVHALNQVVHLDTPASRSAESWLRGVNALLPPSVSLQWVRPVPDTFHARFDAQARSYVYLLRNDRLRSPLLDTRVGWVYRPLELGPMQDAARRLLGEHDFSCFRSSQCQAASPIRSLHALDITVRGPFFIFSFRANAFLHHMIRNIMGALIYVGLGRKDACWIDDLLEQRDRRLAAPTFDPSGLYLAAAHYAPEVGLPVVPLRESLFRLTGFDAGAEIGSGNAAGIY